ncbi:MAG: chemotaxis protein CheW, partial [Calditrichota bacterium]
SVAHLPDCVPGVIRLRSRVIPVVDLQARLSQSNRGKPRPFLIAAAACGEDGQWEVGVTAHSVINVFEIPIINGGQSLVKPISQDKFITGLLQYEGENIRLLSLEQVLFPGGHYFPGNGEQSGNKPTSPPGTFYG